MQARALLVLSLLLGLPAGAHAAESSPDTLSFELPRKGWFVGWGGAPLETMHVDSTVVHAGRYSARLERDAKSASTFTTATRAIPITFSGNVVELRGWLKLRDVQNGFAGLWMREDAKAEPGLKFDNMRKRSLSGTADWAQYSITLPLDSRADALFFGALIHGQGTIWVDGLEIFVDGKPAAEAPPRVKVETLVDKDHEFDKGSNVNVTTVSKTQMANLALLAKVWGFAKYHHPRVTAGEVSWDYELFRVLPGVLEAKSSRDAQEAITTWLDRLGSPGVCNPCATLPDSVQSRARTSWIHDSKKLGKPLVAQLEAMHANRRVANQQWFVSFTEDGNPAFGNERGYANALYPDAGYRLLALFRYWNIIEYWYPDRDIIKKNWDGVLDGFIPRFVAAADRRAYVMEVNSLAMRIDDGHGIVFEAHEFLPPTGEAQLPVALRYVENHYVVHAFTDTLSHTDGDFQIGDALVSIGGINVDSLATAVAGNYRGSNEASRRYEVAFNLTNGPAGPVRVKVKRAGQLLELNAHRTAIDEMASWTASRHDLHGPTFQKLSADVAYVKLSSVIADDCTSYIEQAKGTRCLLIDIRNYPSEFVPFALGGHLVDKPTQFVCFTQGDATNPGFFTWKYLPITIIQPIAPRYTGKLAVLVDEASMSQSEYTAMAFRGTGALIVGSTTAGADGNVSRIPLPGGVRTLMSGIGVFYPNQKPTQQVGIVPDVVVRPTITGIRDGHDEVAEAAVKRLIGVDLRIPTR